MPGRSKAGHGAPRPDTVAARAFCIVTCDGLPQQPAVPSFSGMFVVDEETAVAIRRAWDEGGELAAVAELRRHFAAITDPETARRCLRTIMSWGQGPTTPGQEQD